MDNNNMDRKPIAIFVIFLLASITTSIVGGADPTDIPVGDSSTEKKWTWMFYDDADFYTAGDALDMFASEAFSGENINVLVLQDKEHGPAKIWYIGENHDKNLLQEMGEINMGDYKTLKDFIEYCKNNFSAERYLISFYSYGFGWKGACSDDTSNDHLTMDEMQKALEETGGVDIVTFTAPCIMGAVESVYELRTCTEIYIGSEGGSGYGQWYGIMDDICNMLNNETALSNIEIGEQIIQLIGSNPLSLEDRDVLTMSAVRTDKMDELGEAIDTLSRDLLSNFNMSYDLFQSVYEKIQYFVHIGDVVDIYHLAEKCLDFETNQTIIQDLENVMEKLNESIIAECHGKDRSYAHGLSIHLPKLLKPIYDKNYSDIDYGLDFANDTHWDEFLRMLWLKVPRGIAVGSDIVGDENSVSEILTFIDNCNINMLIVDFGWITWSWNNSQFNNVGILINESKQRNIPTWLMYRARTTSGQYEYLQHQIHEDGEVDERNICFTDNECRNWSIEWAHKLLEKYPTVNGMILYNPYFLSDGCYCPTCLEKFRNDTGIEENPIDFNVGTAQYDEWLSWRARELTSFISEWKNNITSFYSDLQFGLILNSGDYANSTGQDVTTLGEIVDMICPFVTLDSVTDNDSAGKICNSVKEITNATVVADIKIYGPYVNSDDDIINAMKSTLESKGNGFFIWCYDYLDSTKYDLESIITEYNSYYSTKSDFGGNGEIFLADDSNLTFYIFVIVILFLILGILLSIIVIIYFFYKIHRGKKLPISKKVLTVLIIVVAGSVITAGLFYVLTREESGHRFIGRWKIESGFPLDNDIYITFCENNTYSTNYGVTQGLLWGDYQINNEKINLTNPGISGFPSSIVFDYNFSNDGTRLNLFYEGITIVLSKIQEGGASSSQFETGENILQNSGFEEGLENEPLYWYAATLPVENLSMSWDSETKYNGNRSVSINNTHIYDEPVANNWCQSITRVPTGRTVELSGWVKTINAENVVMVMQCWDKDNNMIGFGTTQTEYIINGTIDWQMYNAPVNVPNETDRITVQLVLIGTGQVWFDDVQLIVT